VLDTIEEFFHSLLFFSAHQTGASVIGPAE
jgi:hypothetical protein